MFLNPKQVLDSLHVPSGAKAADFGSGAGHYALLLAEKLKGGGTVYALDALHSALGALAKEASRKKVSVYPVAADLNERIPLADNLLKVGVVANLLHQLKNRSTFVKELSRVMAPSGEVLVVDWASSFRNMGPIHEAVITPGEAHRLFSDAGFTVGRMLPAGTHHYAFVATNP